MEIWAFKVFEILNMTKICFLYAVFVGTGSKASACGPVFNFDVVGSNPTPASIFCRFLKMIFLEGNYEIIDFFEWYYFLLNLDWFGGSPSGIKFSKKTLIYQFLNFLLIFFKPLLWMKLWNLFLEICSFLYLGHFKMAAIFNFLSFSKVIFEIAS